MDADTKTVLAAICEMLRLQIQHSAEVEKALHCGLRALMQTSPDFSDQYRAQIQIESLGSNRDAVVDAAAALQQLDRIIQRLKE